jgi:hypothetical protein
MVMITCCIHAQGLLQKKITIQFKQQTLAAALLQLQNESGISIAFTSAEVKSYEVQAASFSEATVGDILKVLLRPAALQFKESGGYIVIVKEAPKPMAPAEKKQPGVPVKGSVKDAKTKQPVAGITVYIEGTATGTYTDAEGRFVLNAKDSGAMLVVSGAGYEMQYLSIGSVKEFSILLRQDVKALAGVVVEARRRSNTEAALLSERRNAAAISDGISAQNIEKTASITTAQALQRVTGVTISNDRNVAIRGLGDRNVVAQLNGARLSGANPDQNSPPLDLVPAGLLESITVYKTVTADKPADAVAGLIELKTKSIPERMMLSVTVQVGTNTTTGIGGSFTSFKGSDLGPFGGGVKQRDLPSSFYDLSRQFPGGYGQLFRFFYNSRSSDDNTTKANAIDKMEKAIPPVVMNSYRAAAPNQIYTISFGNTLHLKGEQALGIVAGLNYYKRTTEKHDGTLNQYSIFQGSPLSSPTIPPYIDPNSINLGKFAGYSENTGNEQLNFGGLLTLTYRLNKRNEISANYLVNRGAEEGGSYLDGSYQNTGQLYSITNKVYQLTQSYRTFNTLQLRGEHKITGGDYSPQVSWNVSTSHASQLDPDNRFFSLIADSNVFHGVPTRDDPYNPNPENGYYQFLGGSLRGVLPGFTVAINPNGRKFRHLDENNRNYTLDLSLPFKVGGERQLLKLGGYYLDKKRVFSEYVLYLTGQSDGGSSANSLYNVYGNLNAWVGPGRIGFANDYGMEGQPRKVGLLYYPQKTFNNYSGDQRAVAAYGMADLRFLHNWRFTGGVRLESTHILGNLDTLGSSTDPQVYGYVRTGPTGASYDVKLKPYYSGNLTYSPWKATNFRLSYTSTLARPELREMMPGFAFDPFQYAVVIGNPALFNQETRNMDFRWEYFPHPDEVLSISGFYKLIDHQLTRQFESDSGVLHASGSVYSAVRYANDPEQGKVYGLEFELRKGLSGLLPGLRNFYFGANLLLARSIIKKNSERLTSSRLIDTYSSAYSPVFEQPPYSFNAYLDYDNRKSGTDITLNFNVVGPRLIQVRMTGEPDLYDHPVPVLDFVFSQKMAKRFTVKTFVKNILNPAVEQYYATPGGSYTKFAGKTYLNSSYRRGMEIALGLTYDVF